MNRLPASVVAPLLLLLLFGVPGPSVAGWSTDPLVNNPVSRAPMAQKFPSAVSDGQGGAFIVFWDTRDSANTGTNVTAQHFDAQGNPLWVVDGVPVVAVASEQMTPGVNGPGVARDGSGGIFVGFITGPNAGFGPYWIKLQHLNANGVAVWGDSGIGVTTLPPGQINPRLLEDGSGGVFVSWSDGPINSVMVQHYDHDGNALWAPGGVTACSSLIPQSQWMVPDGDGGVILAWIDFRDFYGDLYAQRVDASGLTRWLTNGVPICTAAGEQGLPQICSDGAGGAIVTWIDARSATNKVYARRVTGSGDPVWAADGVPLCTADGTQFSPRIVSDEAGGAIVGWRDSRSGPNDLYVQRVDASGTKLWGDAGLPLCTAVGSQSGLELTPDGASGVIASWTDGRSVDFDLYAQRIDPTGSPLWNLNGVLIAGAPGNQDQITMVGSSGGAIVAFADRRGSSIDLYAQRISADGSLGAVTGIAPGPVSLQSGLGVAPLPAIHDATFSFVLPAAGAVTIRLFDVQGRLQRTLGARSDAGAHRLRWDLRDEHGSRLPGGVYLARLDGPATVRTAHIVILD